MNKGYVSRFLKPSLIDADNSINAAAFDLRDRSPPEVYVSFYEVTGESVNVRFVSGYNSINQKFDVSNKNNAAIVLLDIFECLEEINDEEKDLITFKPQNLPHCGLFYLTTNLVKIQEIKTTLSFLASQNLKRIREIKEYLPAIS